MNLGAATVTASRLGHSMHRPGRRGRLVPCLLALFGRYVGAPLVIGREHEPAGPFMICANHRSHVDSIALINGLDLADRCAMLAARDYFVDGGLWRRLLALPFTVIPVERITPSVSMLGIIREARDFFCAGGQTLISYPEGSRQTGESIGRSSGVPLHWLWRSDCRFCPSSLTARSAFSPKDAGFPCRAR